MRIAQGKKGKPDVMGVLSKRRWVTRQESEWHYISTRLGQMEKEGFKFFFPGAPSEWDPDYLNSVLAHDLSMQMLRVRQKWEADTNKPKLDIAKTLNISEEQHQKNLAISRRFHEHMAKRQAEENDAKD